MKISRYYQAEPLKIGQLVELSKENHRHAVQVLRSEVGSPLVLFNGEGGEYIAHFVEIGKRHSRVKIEAYNENSTESKLGITLVLAMIKPEKMDFAIQKATELGVSKIQPIYTQRSVIKLKANRLEKKMAHWQGVIISASEQSNRTRLAQILAPLSVENWLEQASAYPLKIAMLPGDYPGLLALAESLPSANDADQLALLIGPEGGFTDNEEQLMLQNNVTPVSFGPRILRAETAAIAGITACQLCWGDV